MLNNVSSEVNNQDESDKKNKYMQSTIIAVVKLLSESCLLCVYLGVQIFIELLLSRID